MVGLPDIAPGAETVVLGPPGAEHEIEVTGVSAAGIAVLLRRFPELRRLMTGQGVDVDRLIDMGPEVMAAIIAAGVGAPGDEAQEVRAHRLPISAQADLLAAILRVTLPGGMRPFVAKMQAIGDSVGIEGAPVEKAGASGKGRASRSPKRSKR